MRRELVDEIVVQLTPRNRFQLFPPASDRAAWTSLGKADLEEMRRAADWAVQQELEPLGAQEYMAYARRGDGTYEQNYNRRRSRLCRLILGECALHDGRYMDEIVGLIWAILEESSWVLPRNNRARYAMKPVALPMVVSPDVDGASARTASDLCWAAQLLGRELEEYTPEIASRIRYEVNRRLFIPLLSKERLELGAAGPVEMSGIISGALAAALTMEHDEERRLQLVLKCIQLIQRLLDGEPLDGRIREGVEVWEQVAGEIMDAYSLLFAATNRRVMVYDEPEVIDMGNFLLFSHMFRDEFFCPGAQHGQVTFDGGRVYRYALKTCDAPLADLGAYLLHRGEAGENIGESLMNRIHTAFYKAELEKKFPRQPLPLQDFLPRSGWMMARSRADSEQGFLIYCKGGVNEAGARFHRDAGDFVLYYNALPVLIDIGQFESSAFHNLPSVNGAEQSAGWGFGADEVTAQLEAEGAVISMNLARAYDRGSGALTLQRTLMLNRPGNYVRLVEAFDLSGAQNRVDFHFIFPDKPFLSGCSAALNGVVMEWEQGLSPQLDEIRLTEPYLIHKWGESVFRLTLSVQGAISHDQFTFVFGADGGQ
jgi:hypothetical protein